MFCFSTQRYKSPWARQWADQWSHSGAATPGRTQARKEEGTKFTKLIFKKIVSRFEFIFPVLLLKVHYVYVSLSVQDEPA